MDKTDDEPKYQHWAPDQEKPLEELQAEFVSAWSKKILGRFFIGYQAARRRDTRNRELSGRGWGVNKVYNEHVGWLEHLEYVAKLKEPTFEQARRAFITCMNDLKDISDFRFYLKLLVKEETLMPCFKQVQQAIRTRIYGEIPNP